MSTSAYCQFSLTLHVGGGTVTPDITTGAVSNFSGSTPQGTYRIDYMRGALKYNPMQGWALNATSLNPNSRYQVVYDGGATTDDFPGTTDTNFPSQQAVEDANSGVSMVINHAGGTIGMMLLDDIYGDNVAGNPNPTFGLTRLS